MGDEQLRILERGVRDAGACDETPTKCCTFTALRADGLQTWAQVLAGTVNLHYPFDVDPLEQLRLCSVRRPSGLELIDWEAGTFATFAVDTRFPSEIAFFVDQLFAHVLGCGTDYAPTTMIETLEP